MSSRNELGLLAAIIVVVGLTIAFDDQRTYLNDFARSGEDVLRQSTMLGIFALGSAVVIISGGSTCRAGR